MVREHGEDDDERRIIDNVRQHGWYFGIDEGGLQEPDVVYSIGMFHTLKHPEIVISGLSIGGMTAILNFIGKEIRKGTRLQVDQNGDQFLEGYRFLFRAVHEGLYPKYLSRAVWFYQSTSFPALQCIWPDGDYRYPWHQEYSGSQTVLTDMNAC